MEIFLRSTHYIDFDAPVIQQKAHQLFAPEMTPVEKAKIAYLFVRDEIPHSFDCGAAVITARASDALKYKTGICHAKANLLAALLRAQGIPTGFCFAHLTLAADASSGYCVHAYNAVYLEERWIKLDARGNTKGICAQFSMGEPVLAFPPRKEYDEYCWKGIYANPQPESMQMLENAKTLADIIKCIPDSLHQTPDIAEL